MARSLYWATYCCGVMGWAQSDRQKNTVRNKRERGLGIFILISLVVFSSLRITIVLLKK
jgi:hypothetical protein